MAPRKRQGARSAKPSPEPQAPIVVRLKLPAPGTGDPTYALEKIDDCVRILATHAGPLRVRLREALYRLTGVSARDLPESLRPELEDIWRQTNKNPSRPQQFVRGGPPADGESGTIDATVHFMRNKTLVRMAEVGYTAGSAWFTAKSVMPVEEAEADPCEVNAEADAEGERVWDESLFPICMEFEPVIQRIREAVGVLRERPGLESPSMEALARLKHGLRRLPARTPGMDIGVDLSRQTDANGSRGGLFLRLSEDSFDVEYAGYVIGPCGGDSESRRVLSCENSGYRSDEGCDGAEVLIDLEDWAFQLEDFCRDPDVKVEVSDSGDTHALEDVDTEALWNRMPSHY